MRMLLSIIKRALLILDAATTTDECSMLVPNVPNVAVLLVRNANYCTAMTTAKKVANLDFANLDPIFANLDCANRRSHFRESRLRESRSPLIYSVDLQLQSPLENTIKL